MIQGIAIGLPVLAILLPIGIFFICEHSPKLFRSMLTVNILSFFGVFLFSACILFSHTAQASVLDSESGMKYLSAAISTGLSALAAGFATGSTASAAMGALSENEAIMGKALILVALAEGIAIYGLIISIMILGS